MRFAITATDRYLEVFKALVARGWTPLKVFTSAVDNRLHRNSALIEYAQHLKLDVQISRLTSEQLRELGDRGCETLVVASYPWRIGEWRPHLKYAVNVHPAPLPRGRGPYPAPAAILEEAATWGVCCHKLAHEFDSGDILHRIEFALSREEDHDSLDLKIQLAARRLAGELAEHFGAYWDAATPQGEDGSYYPLWSEADRRLDFTHSVAQILRRVRAFGPIECLAQLNNATLYVRRAVGWPETHAFPAGTVVHANALALVVAVADGYVGLTEWSLISADAVTGTLRR